MNYNDKFPDSNKSFQEMNDEKLKEIIKECIEDIFFSEEEFSPFNSLQDSIKKLLNVAKYEERLDISIKNCDRFEDYMKNVHRLNEMINEFKGLVSIVRGEAASIKRQNTREKTALRKVLEILNEEI